MLTPQGGEAEPEQVEARSRVVPTPVSSTQRRQMRPCARRFYLDSQTDSIRVQISMRRLCDSEDYMIGSRTARQAQPRRALMRLDRREIFRAAVFLCSTPLLTPRIIAG